MEDKAQLVELTADIAAAYLSANTVPAGDLPGLIQTIHQALSGVSSGAGAAPAAEPAKPAVPVKKSITPDYLISLEDGKKYKSLKRHLRTKYSMTPDEYRSKWGLPKDYPMVAPNYAKARSEMARSMGLGQGGRGRKPAAASAAPKTAKAAKPAKAPKAPKAPKAAKAAAPGKRGPGRPPKAAKANGGATAAPAKRGPGRPKKNK